MLPENEISSNLFDRVPKGKVAEGMQLIDGYYLSAMLTEVGIVQIRKCMTPQTIKWLNYKYIHAAVTIPHIDSVISKYIEAVALCYRENANSNVWGSTKDYNVLSTSTGTINDILNSDPYVRGLILYDIAKSI